MKNVLFLLVLMLPIFLSAQTEGEVTYLETIKLNIQIPEEDKAMVGDIPTSDSFTKILLFSEMASIYKDPETGKEEDREISGEGDGVDFRMVIKRPENEYYTDLENGTSINYREFFGRYFLINGQPEKFAWKLTGEQKKVLGYVCQKAVFQDTSRTIEAWFTPQIPVSAGPDKFGGLPGLILDMSLNNGDRSIVATKVDLKTLDKKAIEKPTKGKAVTQEEFNKIEAEKRKEMEQEMGGSGGGMRVIIRN